METVMGAAAENRADKAYCSAIHADNDMRTQREVMRIGLQAAEDCNEFASHAVAYLNTPRGIREKTVKLARTRRGWARRYNKFVAAHARWVDAPPASIDVYAYSDACIKRAAAAKELLEFALGCWSIPHTFPSMPRAIR